MKPNVFVTPLIPVELKGPMPRKACLANNGVSLFWLSMIVMAIGIAGTVSVGIDAVRQLSYETTLHRRGTEAQGKIIKLSTGGKSGIKSVKYSFIANGRVFAGKSLVSNELYSQLLESESLPILFLSTDPDVNQPMAWRWFSSLAWKMYLPLVVILALPLLLLLPLIVERRLTSEGIPAVAVVTACSPGRRGGFKISYEFQIVDGTEARGGDLREEAHEIGDKIIVLYHPRNARQNRLYPSAYYRVA